MTVLTDGPAWWPTATYAEMAWTMIFALAASLVCSHLRRRWGDWRWARGPGRLSEPECIIARANLRRSAVRLAKALDGLAIGVAALATSPTSPLYSGIPAPVVLVGLYLLGGLLLADEVADERDQRALDDAVARERAAHWPHPRAQGADG